MIFNIDFPSGVGKQYDSFCYPAGESQVRLRPEAIKELASADEVRVWATIGPRDWLIELVMLMDAVRKCTDGVIITLALPYLPYARADRRFVVGDCFGLKVAGDIIGLMFADRIVTLDVHSPKANSQISGLVNISPLPVVENVCTELGGDTTILLPDAGAARYDFRSFGVRVRQCEKVRDAATGKLSGFVVPKNINTGRVLVVDDICDGGGTFLGIADELDRVYKTRLKKSLYVTHGIFSQGFEELHKRFDTIHCTDSFPSLSKTLGNCKIFSARKLIEESIDVS